MRTISRPLLVTAGVGLSVGLLAALVSAPALGNGFFWDDPVVIERQLPAIGGPIGALIPPATLPNWSPAYYRPLTTLTLLVDRALWGTSPRGYHATVLLLHALTASAIFLLAHRIVSSGAGAIVRPAPSRASLAGAATAGVLFAVHPVHAEAVGWISGRADILTTLLTACALLAALGMASSVSDSRPRRSLAIAALGATCVLASCGALLAKEAAIVMPVLAAAALWGAPRRAKVLPIATVTCGIALALLVRTMAIGGPAHMQARAAGESGMMADLAGGAAFAARRLALPWTWSGFHSRIDPPRLVDLAAILVLAAVAVTAWRTSRAGQGMVLFTSAALLPAVGPIVLGVSFSPIADRYLYMASAGLALMVGAITAALAGSESGAQERAQARRGSESDGLRGRAQGARTPRSPARAVAGWLAAAIVAALAIDSARTVARYRDDLSFWSAAARRSAGDGYARLKWGQAILASGSAAEAEEVLRAALRLGVGRTDTVIGLDNLAQAVLLQGRAEEAREILVKLVPAAPRYVPARLHLAQAHREVALAAARHGRPRELSAARSEVDAALAIEPENRDAQLLLVQLLLDTGDEAGARRALERALPLLSEPEKARWRESLSRIP